MKNIGALAMLMPVAFQLARRNNKPVSALLMPMSFAALLGGIVTLVGTSPNIIVSRVREEIIGAAVQDVRLHAGRRRHRHRRPDLPGVRLAAAAARPQGRGLDGRRLQHRGLHHRGGRSPRIRRSPARP